MKYSTPDKMSDLELVALVLGNKADEAECHRVACALFDERYTDGKLADTAHEYGIAASNRLVKVQAAIELGRRAMVTATARKLESIQGPEDVAELMNPMINGRERETFWCVCVNTKNKVIKMTEVAVGSLSATIVHPREVFSTAVRLSAASIIIVHNHPSGDPTPSGADIQLTRRLVKAGEMLGIEVLDHVMLGGDKHLSMRDEGLM